MRGPLLGTILLVGACGGPAAQVVDGAPLDLATASDGDAATRTDNRIAVENRRRGATNWWVPYPQWSMHHEVEGYPDKPSYAAGETVAVQLSSISTFVKWHLYRAGWYGGAGAREIARGTTLAAQQPLPPPSTWEVPCEPRWNTTFRVRLPEDAVSGIYFIRLDAGWSSFMTFVVREDDRAADLMFQRSDFTDAMYNNWDGATNRSSWYGAHPEWVSLDRPMRSPAGWLYPYSAGFFTYEYSMVRFLEREGYDVTYVSNYDVHSNPHLLDRARAFLSVGHDEYWSPEMRDRVEGARDRGVSLGFFSSDACDGELRFRRGHPHVFSTTTADSTASAPLRNEWQSKPLDLEAPPHDNPTDSLLGTHYISWCGSDPRYSDRCWADGFAKMVLTDPAVVTEPTHPIFRNVMLGSTSSLGRIMGYEYEGLFAQPRKLPFTPQVVAKVPGIDAFDELGGPPVMVAYQHASGAHVFNAGSMDFIHGLDGWVGRAAFRKSGGERPCASGETDCFDVESVAVQQLTVNVLADMGARRATPSPDLIDSPAQTWP